MNLQVNLILDSEKRSGSTISLKFLVRVLAGVIPIILGIVIAGLVLGVRSAKQSFRSAEQEKSQVDPVYKSVMSLKQELENSQRLSKVLNGWSASRNDWFVFLRGLQTVVPPSIQLLRLTVNETIEQVGNAPARISGIYMKGKVIGEQSEQDVQSLDQALRLKPPFKDILSKVEVKRFEASENVTDKNTRVFDIECILIPKKIDQPKP